MIKRYWLIQCDCEGCRQMERYGTNRKVEAVIEALGRGWTITPDKKCYCPTHRPKEIKTDGR
jgi:hypothetical protein